MERLDQVLDEITPTLESMEHDRVAFRKKRSQCLLAVILPGSIVALIIGFVFFPFGFFGVVLWIILASVIYHFMAGQYGKAYVDSYKDTVLTRLVQLVSGGLEYRRTAGIDEHRYLASELFTTRPDRYQTEDLIQGTFGKTSLALAEIHAEEKRQSRDSKGNTQTRWVTIFKGLFLIADFHKHFHGRTFIFPDSAERLFGGFGRTLQKLGGRGGTSLAQMDDPEFEQAFAAHTTDQVEARYILSPSMMRRILDLRQKFGKDVRLAFKESCVWIAVPHKAPFLEPDTRISATDRGQVEKMLTEIASFLDIVEELDLNTRIWTKE